VNKPVHVCIRDDLRKRLINGEWVPGERLPSETDLAARYGVARMTVRQAIGALALEGIIVRRQGLGTFAAESHAAGRTDELPRLAGEVRGQGPQVSTRIISAAIERPPSAAQEALGLRESALSVMVRGMRVVDRSPVAVMTSWLPYNRFAGLDKNPSLDGSLYAMLEAHYGVRIVRAREVFTAEAASASDAADLEISPGAPVLLITRTSYDGANRAVIFTLNATRSNYPIETVAEFRPPAARTEVGRVPNPAKRSLTAEVTKARG
jgi:GntR family transcriptional regulator